MLKECGIEKFDQTITIKPIKNQGKKSIDLQKIAANISNKESDEYWETVSKKCFGCGVCSAVCPLCFCFRNEMVNNPDGSCHTDIYSDSCYSCRFRKTNYKNYGANRSSRMKSWYSHKFERSAARNGKPLCTGCGRCIENCPADLNQFAIISALDEKVD